MVKLYPIHLHVRNSKRGDCCSAGKLEKDVLVMLSVEDDQKVSVF